MAGITAPVIVGLVVGILFILILSSVPEYIDALEQERLLYIMYASLHAEPLQDRSEIPLSTADKTFTIDDHDDNAIRQRLPLFMEVLENAQSKRSTVTLSASQVSMLFEIAGNAMDKESRELHKDYFPGTNVLVTERNIAVEYKGNYYLLTLEMGLYRIGM